MNELGMIQQINKLRYFIHIFFNIFVLTCECIWSLSTIVPYVQFVGY